MQRVGIPEGGTWHEVRTRLRQGSGLARSADVDDVCASIVAASDGVTPLAEVLAGVAVAYGLAPGDLVGTAAPTVRGLVSDGFLRPVTMVSCPQQPGPRHRRPHHRSTES